MIVYLADSLDIFVCHHGRLPATLVGDDAAQMNDAILNDDAETERTPHGVAA